MAFADTINGLKDKVRGLLRREPKAMDAFGGDDLFDGDGEDKPNLGPKIAMAVSGVMLLALASLVVVMVMTGDKEAAQTGGSLAGLELEEEPDSVASTDRSVERRPWLTPTDGGSNAPRRFGIGSDDKDKSSEKAEKKEETKKEETKVAAAPPPSETPSAKTEEPKPAAPAAEAPKQPEPAKPAAPVANAPKPEPAKPTQVAENTAPAPTTPGVEAPKEQTAKPEAKPETPAAIPAPGPTGLAAVAQEEEKEEEQQVAAMPSLMAPAETAPGAPRRFDTADVGAASAGGRPRLNDPKLPPTDKISVGAPPPRFSAINDIKTPETAASSAKLAIIVEDLGLNRTATEAALAKLPPTVTLAFSPYARDLKRWMERAKAKGHEVLIEVPMESKAFPAEDPGPLGLLTSLEEKDNQDRLDAILKEASGASGIYDSMGSKFREAQSQIGDVFAKLKQQNLFYVQGRPGVRVGDAEIPTATTDVVIDERPFRAAVDARFDFAEKLAKYQGSAVAVMSARPVSFERLALWADQLPKKGVTIAPISQVLVQ